MKKKKSIAALTVVGLCSLLIFAGCKRNHHHHGAFALDYVVEVLDLTEAQEKKLDSIHEEIFAKVELMHKDKEKMHDTLKEQINSERIDKEVIRGLVKEHRAQMDSVIELAIDKLTDFHSELTPDQRAKLVAKLEKFEKKRGRCFRR